MISTIKDIIEHDGSPDVILEALVETGVFNLLYTILQSTPDAENYIIIPFKNVDGTKHNYNLILHKAGKLVPTQAQVDKVSSR